MYIEQEHLDEKIQQLTPTNQVPRTNTTEASATVHLANVQQAGAEYNLEQQLPSDIVSNGVIQATDFFIQEVQNINPNAVKTPARKNKTFADSQKKEYENGTRDFNDNEGYNTDVNNFQEDIQINEYPFNNLKYSDKQDHNLSNHNFIEIDENNSNIPTHRSRTRRSVPNAIEIQPFHELDDFDDREPIKFPNSVHLQLNSTLLNNRFVSIEDCDHYNVFINEDQNIEIEKIVQDSVKNSQMVMDIYNRLRKFFNKDSTSNHESQDSTRKRRSEDRSPDANNPHLIKYRKVDNRFPKFLARSFEEDPYELKFSIPSKHEKLRYLQNSHISNRVMDASKNNPLQSADKKNQRNSIFATPKLIQKIVKNTNFTDIEFSDDDDEPQIIDNGPNDSSEKNGRYFNTAFGHQVEYGRAKQLPPPLIDPRSGHVLGSSAMPGLGKQTGRSWSAASTSASVLDFGMPWLGDAFSATSQENDNDDRNKYQQLLEKVVPRLYNSNKTQQFPKTEYDIIRPRQNAVFHDNLTFGRLNRNNRSSTAYCDKRTALEKSTLLSSIYLDDDDDEFDVVLTHDTKKLKSETPVIIDDDDNYDITEIVDITVDDEPNVSRNPNEKSVIKPKTKEKDKLPYVERVNSLKDRFSSSPHAKENWLEAWQAKWMTKKKACMEEVKVTEKVAEKLTQERRAAELEIQERFKTCSIYDPEILVIDEFPEPEVEKEEPEFLELTPEQKTKIRTALSGPPDQVIISKFNLNIARRDIHTLIGHNWLNDEVINFYMSLLTERGEQKNESHGLPRVYAMNTFFIPRLMQAGHSGVKRWTRKVDIFSKDVIPVPVHVGGVHWCMAIIHLKNRTILYYDSMGTPNPNVLRALENYLKEESLDKRKQHFDTSNFEIESVRNVPRQMNGSDCGVFSCMFAEFITRNKPITFSQENMEYFRQKMIVEIAQGQLLR